MNLDTMYVAAFIRQDMFPDHQMVHTFHLGMLIGKAMDGFCQKRHTLSGHPNIILFGVPNESAIAGVMDDLQTLGIEFISWRDPDCQPGHDDYGTAGLVTEPLTKPRRNKLTKYRPWRNKGPAPEAVQALIKELETPTPDANAYIVQPDVMQRAVQLLLDLSRLQSRSETDYINSNRT